MSIQAMSWALETELPPLAKLVLIALGNHADERGSSCWPSQQTIGKEASVTGRTARSWIRWLEVHSWLTRQARMSTEGRGRTSDSYELVGWERHPDHVRPQTCEGGLSCDHLDDQPEGASGETQHDQPETHARPTGSSRTTNRKPASGEPSRTVKNRQEEQGDAEDRGDSLTPRFPTRPSAQNRYVDAVWGWMQGQNIKVDPRWPKAEKYKAALRVATDKLGVATTAGETAGIHLGCEYARDVRGDLHPAASKHMAALVGNYGPLVAFDAVVRAIDQGAGLDDEFADKPKALTHYALAIIRSDRNEAARV